MRFQTNVRSKFFVLFNYQKILARGRVDGMRTLTAWGQEGSLKQSLRPPFSARNRFWLSSISLDFDNLLDSMWSKYYEEIVKYILYISIIIKDAAVGTQPKAGSRTKVLTLSYIISICSNYTACKHKGQVPLFKCMDVYCTSFLGADRSAAFRSSVTRSSRMSDSSESCINTTV